MSRYNKSDGCAAWMVLISVLFLIIAFVYKTVKTNIEEILYVFQNVWCWVTVIIVCVIVSSILIYKYRKIIKNKDYILSETIINKDQILSKTIINKDLEIKNRDLQISKLEKEITNLTECIKSKDSFYNSILTLSDISVSNLTELVSDFKLVQYDISAKYLRTKDHPAHGEAQRINDLKKVTKLYHEQYKQMVYKYEALIGLFPELSTYIDDFESIKELNDFRNLDNLQSDYDRVRDFISKDEYNQLNNDEKNQLALNRYITGKKSKWQIGRDYEMYIAHLYRSKGWTVIQYGIEKKLEDMGRDLIVFGKDKVLIVQCKYWSETKLIHEKHIAQLYGSTIEYALFNSISISNVEPVFITNIDLSEKAKQFAKTLKVTVFKIDLGSFPRIKCNVNNNEKIYHLPFDQQYDRTKIENEGEMYKFNVKEAVDAGFRRALRFYGTI